MKGRLRAAFLIRAEGSPSAEGHEGERSALPGADDRPSGFSFVTTSKRFSVGDAESGRYGDVGGVAAVAHDDTADAGMVVARVHRPPAAVEKDLVQALKSPGLTSAGTPMSPR